MILYLDSSALVKLYINEAYSQEVQTLVQSMDHLCCHSIGYVEVRAALASAERGQRLCAEDYALVVSRFKADWSGISQIEVNSPLLERAADCAEGFALRGYDSVHLAAADKIYRAMADSFMFISFDKQLNRAAHLLGMGLPEFILLSGEKNLH